MNHFEAIVHGEFEGGVFRQMSMENHPAVVEMRAKQDWGAIPGGETNAELTARTTGAIERMASAHPDQMIAAFCHGGVIGAVLGHAAGVGPFTFNGARHTSISHLVINGPGDWVIRSFNDGAHVGQLTVDYQLPAAG